MGCCTVNISVPECISTLILPVGLSEGYYSVRIIDRFNKAYNKDFPVDENGDMTISIDAYPVGLFTRYSGTARLEVFSAGEQQLIHICDNEYKNITLTFYAVDNETETTTHTHVCSN